MRVRLKGINSVRKRLADGVTAGASEGELVIGVRAAPVLEGQRDAFDVGEPGARGQRRKRQVADEELADRRRELAGGHLARAEPQRQVRLATLSHPASDHPLGVLDRDPPLSLLHEHH